METFWNNISMPLTYEVRENVACITMDDGKVNAVTVELAEQLLAAIERAESEAGAILLAGRAGKFSAGFDLKVMQGGDSEAANALLNLGGRVALRLMESPLPTVALCTGHALAMGALILLACDTRIGVAGDFKIGLNETAIGMALPVFGVEIPRVRLASSALTAAVVQSRLYDPETAVGSGYLDAAEPAETAAQNAFEMAVQFAALPGAAYAANKRSVLNDAIEIIKPTLS